MDTQHRETEHTFSPRPWHAYGIIGVVGLCMLGWVLFTVFTGREWATMQQGDTRTYVLRVADNPLEKAHGLANTDPEDLGDAMGMIFVYNDAEPRTFTMEGMDYDLDFMWLKNGKIVRIDKAVPAPKNGEAPKTLSSSPLNVDMVIEVPAGRVDQLGYMVGHTLTINLNP